MRVIPTVQVTKRLHQAPPISLTRVEKEELHKGEYLNLKLLSVPDDPSSQTYELAIPYFGTGSPEAWLKFRRDLDRVFSGQSMTTGPPKYAMARRLLEGDALAKFDESATQAGAQTNANFQAVMTSVTTHIFPKKSLAYQKRYMRRFMRKPRDMSTRLFVARVTELNAYLEHFPPYAENQRLANDELMDIFEFSIPNAWQKEAIRQGFDIMQHTASEFVEFCERLESTEDTPIINKPEGKLKATRKRKINDTSEAIEKARGKKYCMLHGAGAHTTEECRTLKVQASRMRATYLSQSPEGKRKMKFSKNHDKSEETNAIVQAVMDQMTKANKSQKNIKSKKRDKPDPIEEIHSIQNEFSNIQVSTESDTSDDE
jgi:hypothetical protein